MTRSIEETIELLDQLIKAYKQLNELLEKGVSDICENTTNK